MFGISVEKLFVLVLVALFVGPERLPAAAAWVGQTMRRVRGFATQAQQQLRDQVGPEFDQFREPLQQLREPLQQLRTLGDPRRALLEHLLGDNETPPAPPTSSLPAVALQSPEAREALIHRVPHQSPPGRTGV